MDMNVWTAFWMQSVQRDGRCEQTVSDDPGDHIHVECDIVEDAWAHETFRWVVGFIIGLKEPLPIGDVGALLDLRRTPTSNPIDILAFRDQLANGIGSWDRRDHEGHDSPAP
jgi:hypothetical protein